MKKSIVVFAAAALATVTPMYAALIFNFDERGNGSISLNGGAFTPVIGTRTANPSCASLAGGLCLTYIFPVGTGTIGNGDVGVFEPPSTSIFSDGIRFTDANGGLTGSTADRLIFFSDFEGVSDGDLADTGLPTNFGSGTTATSVTETGVEGGLQTFQFVASGPNVYNGTSDFAAVPEPGTMSLLLVSGAVLFASWTRQVLKSR